VPRRRFAAPLAAILAALLVLAAPLAPPAAAAEPPVLLLPAEPVPAGGSASAWLLFINTTGQEQRVAFPARLPGRLRLGSEERAVVLEPASPAEAGEAVIPPGGHARREYRLSVPAGLEGQAILALEAPRLNPAVLQVRRPEVAAPPSAPVFDVTGAHTDFDPVGFFRDHFSGYEPLYFIAGLEPPNAKFQISFKYQLLSNRGALVQRYPLLRGFFLGYTQTSVWDWSAPSAPFEDSSYRPELFYRYERVDAGRWADWLRLDLQAGLQHESNGRGGADSRSLNIGYAEPGVTLGRKDGLRLRLAPRVFAYLGDLSDNPDLKDYRGHLELRSRLGWERGLDLAATGRLGDDWDRGSLQLDLTYPMAQFVFGGFSPYLHLQYFYGYGETLLRYNERGSSIRLGIAIYR